MTVKELSEMRYSVRSYKKQPVEQEKLDYIMDCVRLAPSAVNFQPWKFYVVKKEDDKEKLRKCYSRDWFNEAPVYIIACINHEEEWVRKYDGKRHGDIDIAIAVEHLCLAAVEQELGTCWVCNFDAKLCHELFRLPENEEAAVLIPLGYPAGETTLKKRKAMDEIMVEL